MNTGRVLLSGVSLFPWIREKNKGGGRGRAVPLLFSLPLHVVEHPVPDDHEAGDDHKGEQPGAEECPDNDEFVVHRYRLSGKRCNRVGPCLDPGPDCVVLVRGEADPVPAERDHVDLAVRV